MYINSIGYIPTFYERIYWKDVGTNETKIKLNYLGNKPFLIKSYRRWEEKQTRGKKKKNKENINNYLNQTVDQGEKDKVPIITRYWATPYL